MLNFNLRGVRDTCYLISIESMERNFHVHDYLFWSRFTRVFGSITDKIPMESSYYKSGWDERNGRCFTHVFKYFFVLPIPISLKCVPSGLFRNITVCGDCLASETIMILLTQSASINHKPCIPLTRYTYAYLWSNWMHWCPGHGKFLICHIAIGVYTYHLSKDWTSW